MERRGVYRKGSAGHVRNASPYKISMDHFKRWRVPYTIVAGLFLVFGMSPAVGDQLTASVLTLPGMSAQISSQPKEARKTILQYVHDLSKECERFLMNDCVAGAQGIIAQASDDSNDIQSVLAATVSFEKEFSSQLAHNACKFDLAQTGFSLAKSQSELATFTEKYGESMADPSLALANESLKTAVDTLKMLGDSCQSN